MATNAHLLLTTRLRASIQPATVNVVTAPDGRTHALPGQGGVLTNIALGSLAANWHGDHVEPGVSLGHADPAANHAIRLFSCVGNRLTVLDGPAAGATGMVFGKHGAVLGMFAPETLVLLAPGEHIAIEANGVGLALNDMSDVTCHSLSPALFDALVQLKGDRLRIPVAAILPSIAAAAGIGMPAAMFNMDLHHSGTELAEAASRLRFGDIVAVRDQDHRYGRQHRPGWMMVGIVSHGRALGGGHGLGLMTLLTAPAARFDLVESADARLDRLLPLPFGAAT